MGLIKAAIGAVSSTLSDTWKDYFVCEALPDNLLMVKGTKKGKGLFAKDDVITNGSGIVVADGQCAIIVDDGLVVEVAAEPGNYTFDTSSSPSIFDGGLKGLKDTFATMVERFQYGGITNRSQHVYYINTKELTGNKYGTASPVPFKVSDPSINLNNFQVMLKCNGEYSIKVNNPILFYKNVAGNANQYYKETLDSQMRSELLTALAPALAKLSLQGVNMYSDIPLHTFELAENLNEVLSSKWSNLRGISIVSFGINSIIPRDEDLAKIQNLQEGASLRDANAAAGALAAAQAQAMRDAANNANGAMAGFAGINMAQSQSNVASLFAQGAAQAPAANQQAGDSWTCECGNVNNGNFCSKCGKAKPQNAFCPNCGKPVPSGAAFCPNCGKALS